jgi:adenylate kinase family enzyme
MRREPTAVDGRGMSMLERVVVMGTSGSGKTTFARELASLLGATHVELDAFYWGPKWTPREEFVQDVTRLAAEPRWVVDGNYSAVRDVLWSRATTVVWLDYAFLLTFTRAVSRTVRRMISQETYYAGNRESFRNAFLDFNGIPWWVIRTYRRRRREMPKLMRRPEYRHIEFRVLRNPNEAAAFLGNLHS